MKLWKETWRSIFVILVVCCGVSHQSTQQEEKHQGVQDAQDVQTDSSPVGDSYNSNEREKEDTFATERIKSFFSSEYIEKCCRIDTALSKLYIGIVCVGEATSKEEYLSMIQTWAANQEVIDQWIAHIAKIEDVRKKLDTAQDIIRPVSSVLERIHRDIDDKNRLVQVYIQRQIPNNRKTHDPEATGPPKEEKEAKEQQLYGFIEPVDIHKAEELEKLSRQISSSSSELDTKPSLNASTRTIEWVNSTRNGNWDCDTRDIDWECDTRDVDWDCATKIIDRECDAGDTDWKNNNSTIDWDLETSTIDWDSDHNSSTNTRHNEDTELYAKDMPLFDNLNSTNLYLYWDSYLGLEFKDTYRRQLPTIFVQTMKVYLGNTMDKSSNNSHKANNTIHVSVKERLDKVRVSNVCVIDNLLVTYNILYLLFSKHSDALLQDMEKPLPKEIWDGIDTSATSPFDFYLNLYQNIRILYASMENCLKRLEWSNYPVAQFEPHNQYKKDAFCTLCKISKKLASIQAQMKQMNSSTRAC
ncbi:hypothetical protein NECID01_2021 [Nematocida sp. AWRm77]|nr:hypothetical protein NECID01_2021 [Nematocida sp. AWRm77]